MNQLSLLGEIDASVSIPVPPAPISANGNSKQSLDFDQVVGQGLAISLLSSVIASNRIAPAYLFAGIDGIGKTLTARIFVSKLLESSNIANHPDVLWVEPTHLHQGALFTFGQLEASGITRTSKPSIRVEQVREIAQFLSQSALAGTRKVVVVSDAHQMNPAAANALLKTLEEPGSNSCIILLSSQSLLPTIISRCSVVPFRPLCPSDLKLVLENLGKTDVLSQPTVLAMAAGSPGLAITYDQIYRSLPPKLLELRSTSAGSSILEALQVTKEIKELGLEQQRWLLDFLQHQWWAHYQDGELVAKVEAAKLALNKSVSPRLVWDVLLMPLNN
jgi:DNA polymerase-3 subunit delta'